MQRYPRGEPPPHDTGLSDQQLETLLHDFFRRELPEEMRQFSPAGDLRASSFVSSSRSRSVTLAGFVAVMAAILLTYSVLLTSPAVLREPPRRNNTVAHRGNKQSPPGRSNLLGEPVARPEQTRSFPVVPAATAARSGSFETTSADSSVDTPTVPVEYAVIERLDPIERLTYDTSDGPVEQRTDIRTTNVSVFESDSGAQLDLMLSELTIEVVPVKEN